MEKLKIIYKFICLFGLYNILLPFMVWFINSQIIYFIMRILFDEITWWTTMKWLMVAYFCVAFYKFQIESLSKNNVIKMINEENDNNK